MPGKRIKVGHIEAIPDATDIGPYRNIVLHTGINNINSTRYRKSNKELIEIFEKKCKNILEVYPRARLYVSLLLPTKITTLNYRVREFNNLLIDMAYWYKNIIVIDHPTFGNTLSCNYGRYDTNENCPNFNDALHLGKKGIRVFVKELKDCVMKRGYNRSHSKFNADRNNQHKNAARRSNGHVDGYQPPA